MSFLDALARDLLNDAGPGTPAQPPPGVVLGLQGPAGGRTVAAAGSRSVCWHDGVRRPGAPMTGQTPHDLASVTKVLGTTACLLRMTSLGLLDLDVAVRHFLPAFDGGGREAVTVRDLLLHRGGLQQWYPLYAAADDAAAAVAVVCSLPLGWAPGTERHYSDLGFILLGRIISAVLGLPLDAAVQALVAGPLGLDTTRYARPAGGEAAMAARDDRIEAAMLDTGQPYPVPFRSTDFARWRTGPIQGEVADGNAFHTFAGVAGHAGLFSTVPDLLRFAAALADYRSHEDLWDPLVAEEFFRPGPDPEQALGFRRFLLPTGAGPVAVLGHPGFTGCAVGFVPGPGPGAGAALALAGNRLLVDREPVPTDALWRRFLQAVAPALAGVR